MADQSSEILTVVAKPRCNDFAQASSLEWLETNHTGAFAMGTVAGVNTRRYHGLLIATLHPPADRYSLFSRVAETVEFCGKSFELATVQYPGTVSPRGYEFLEEFSFTPCPTWRYRCDTAKIEKSIRLIEGKQSVFISYRSDVSCRLTIQIFLSFRDYHSLAKENPALNPGCKIEPAYVQFRPYSNLPPLTIHHNGSRFEKDGIWFHNHEYLRELERGLDFREDLYSPGSFHFSLAPDEEAFLFATLEAGAFIKPPLPQTVAANPLKRALDQFRVARADGKPTLLAGYPWFTDWSRDTLISLPALTVAGFDPAETKSVLEFLLSERKQGILPNRFSDSASTPEYNTVDASLWFFVAADCYINSTQDIPFLRDTLLPTALDIIHWHTIGTFYGIKVDPADHLLAAGGEGTQLTWMDAKIGDYVVTPRVGKPVEINALWFNALKITSQWAAMTGDITGSSNLLAEAVEIQTAFQQGFWNESRGCLYDVLTPTGPDASLRPNQLFAVSLPYPLLNPPQARSMVEVVKEHLLTPAGLRTLEPADPNYRPRFDGDMRSRDSAYHQGTVWPWLIGPFVNAYLYAYRDSLEAREFCRNITNSTLALANDYCLGSIGEVYDGESPHHPGGCPAQLWSVAQLILALARLKSS